MNTQEAVVYRKDELWVAETKDGKVHVIMGQHPWHSVLSVGRDENRRAMIEVMDSDIGLRAEFRNFI